MAKRQPNKLPTKRITITLPEVMADYLEQLACIGVGGPTPAEVARYFVVKAIEEKVDKRTVALPPNEKTNKS